MPQPVVIPAVVYAGPPPVSVPAAPPQTAVMGAPAVEMAPGSDPVVRPLPPLTGVRDRIPELSAPFLYQLPGDRPAQ